MTNFISHAEEICNASIYTSAILLHRIFLDRLQSFYHYNGDNPGFTEYWDFHSWNFWSYFCPEHFCDRKKAFSMYDICVTILGSTMKTGYRKKVRLSGGELFLYVDENRKNNNEFYVDKWPECDTNLRGPKMAGGYDCQEARLEYWEKKGLSVDKLYNNSADFHHTKSTTSSSSPSSNRSLVSGGGSSSGDAAQLQPPSSGKPSSERSRGRYGVLNCYILNCYYLDL